MPNFIIKTHQKNVVYKQPHIFILNKGLNSGKPQKEPFTNSFVVIFSSEEDLETTYWLAVSLWQSKFWNRYLVGSVIPFLRINEFQSNFNPKVREMLDDFEAHQRDVKALQLLELKKEQFHQNIYLINDIRRIILHRYCKKN